MAENKIPSIGPNPASAADFTSPAAFPIQGGAVSGFGDLPRFLADDGATSIALVRPDIAAGAITGTFGNATLAKVGQKLTHEVPVPNDAPDMSAYVQSALADGTDGIMVGLGGQQAQSTSCRLPSRRTRHQARVALDRAGEGARSAGSQTPQGIIQSAAVPVPVDREDQGGHPVPQGDEGAGYKDDEQWASTPGSRCRCSRRSPKASRRSPAAAVFDKLNTTTGLETGLTPPLQWTTPADIGLAAPSRSSTSATLAVKLTKTEGEGGDRHVLRRVRRPGVPDALTAGTMDE